MTDFLHDIHCHFIQQLIQKLFGAINYKAVHVADSTTATIDADVDIPDLTRLYNIEVWSCFDVLGEYAHDSFNGLFHAGVIFLFHVGVLLKIEWMGDAPLHTYPLHG